MDNVRHQKAGVTKINTRASIFYGEMYTKNGYRNEMSSVSYTSLDSSSQGCSQLAASVQTRRQHLKYVITTVSVGGITSEGKTENIPIWTTFLQKRDKKRTDIIALHNSIQDKQNNILLGQLLFGLHRQIIDKL